MQVINLRKVTAALGVTALATVVAALTAAPAQAAPAAGAGSTRDAAVTSAAATSSDGAGFRADHAEAYWTAKRMRSARSAQAPADATATSGAAARQATGAPGSTPATTAERPTNLPAGAAQAMGLRPDEVRPMVNASATVGRAFFHDPVDGRDYACSASTLNSGSKLLVITAGHCVHRGKGGQWMQNWIFVPLYNYGAQPYGSWSARWLTTFDSWISSSNLDRDVGFVTVWRNGAGQRIVDVVGGNGLSWNYSYNESVTILGYPAEPPYDGGWQQYCQGTTSRPGTWPFQENKIQLHCGFTGGSSGGPWLRVYNGTWGNVNGVMSTLNSSGWNKSPYFDDSVHNVYVSVADRT